MLREMATAAEKLTPSPWWKRVYGILVRYLVLFFGAILLMGLPMFRVDRQMWLVTAATTVLLLGSMGIEMSKVVG